MKKIAIFGFSANPPANHHLAIVKKLIEIFDKVIVIPRGTDSNKPSTTETTPLQRKEMVKLVFENMPQVSSTHSINSVRTSSSRIEIDFSDLDHNIYTRTWRVDLKYKKIFPGSEIWHVVGGDIIEGAAGGNSEIETKWQKGKEIWNNLNWAIIDHPDYPINPSDLPPKNMLIEMDAFRGRSTLIRNKIKADQSINGLVSPAVEKYILENNLYK